MARAATKAIVKPTRDELLAELEEIRNDNGGLLRAEDVVAFAADPKTALHTKFTWEDSEAAQKYRLMQARQVIRVHVKVFAREKKSIRAFVSMANDRAKGGGYRSTEEVLHVAEMRDQLLYQAYREMKAFVKRYEHLDELAGVIASIEGALVVDDEATG